MHVQALLPKPVVLIVDDEPANLGTFVRSFRKEFVVRIATSGSEALRELDHEPADVVITDYTMPEMNGVELLRLVAVRWPGVKRLIISGHSDLPELHNAERLGFAAGLLPKPWRKPEILETIGRLLATR